MRKMARPEALEGSSFEEHVKLDTESCPNSH
jgi:hypothetical protein